MKPLFSIILPTYNRAARLLPAINEIQRQSISNWELIIVDDSEQDQSRQLLGLNDNRIKYFCRSEKLGVASARNFGVDQASGDYIIFFDDDDETLENWLFDFQTAIVRNPESELIICSFKVVDAPGMQPAIIKPNHNIVDKKLGSTPLQGSFCIAIELFMKAGGYDPNLSYAEHTEFFYRIMHLRPIVTYIDTSNYIYNSSADGGSKNTRNKINGLKYILDKHAVLMDRNPHIKRAYLQIIGVAYLRLGEYKKPRKYLWRAFLLNPLKIKTGLRFIVSLFPIMAKSIYKMDKSNEY